MAAPVLPLNITIEFGADTQTGGGGFELSRLNTGGTIAGGGAGNSISGTNSSHFAINAAGVIYVTQTGRTAGLLAGAFTYEFTVTVRDSGGISTVANVTIVVSPNTQHIGVLAGASNTTTTPDTRTQIINATATSNSTTRVGYGVATTPRTVIYRPDTTAVHSNSMFNSPSALVTHISEDFDNPFVLTFASGTRAVDRRWSPYNIRIEGWEVRVTLDRYAEKAANILNALNGNHYGINQFYKVKFKCSTIDEVGYGESFNGLWGANVTPTIDTYVLYDQCEFSGFWNRGLSPLAKGSLFKEYIVRNCVFRDIRSDGVQVNGPVVTVEIDGNDFYEFNSDTYQMGWVGGYAGTPPTAFSAVVTRSGAAQNVSNDTKATIVWQINNFGRGGRLIDFGGIEVSFNNDPTVSGNGAYDASLNVTVKDPAGVTIFSGSTTTKFRQCCRQSAILSIDTTGTSRLWIREERGVGIGTWVEELTFTAAGQTIDLTSTMTIGGVKNNFPCGLETTAIIVWPQQALNAASSTTQNNLFSSIGHMEESNYSTSVTAYGTPNVVWFNDFRIMNVGSPPNRGNGGPFSKTGSTEAAHGDMCQFAPGIGVTGWKVRDNVIISINTRAARYNFDAYQIIFQEDVNPTGGAGYPNNHYTSGEVSGNIGIGNTNYGINICNAVNCLIEENTLVQHPLFPPSNGGAYPPISLSNHNNGTGSGNIVRRNISGTSVAPAAVSVNQTYDVANSIGNLYAAVPASAKLQGVGIVDTAYSYANLFVGDGGVHDLSTPAKVRAYFARKPGGYAALNDVGANPTAETSGSAPVNTIPPTISPGADNYVGSTGTVTDFGTWLNGVNSYNVQWQRDAANVGSTASSKLFDIAGTWRIALTATNDNGTSTPPVYSNEIVIIDPPTYVANNDVLELTYAGSGSISPLANDLNLDDVTAVSGGNAFVSAVLNLDNSITVTALQGFGGSVDFTVTCTGNGGAVTRTSTLTVIVPETKSFTLTTS